MQLKPLRGLLFAGLLLWAPSGGQAEETAAGEPDASGSWGDRLLGDLAGVRSSLAASGWSFTVDYTGEVLGNISGGKGTGAVYEGLLSIVLEAQPEQWGLWKGGLLHVCGLYPHGDSLTKLYTGDLFTLSNIDAEDSPRLFEFWYEQELAGEWASIRTGLMGADQEFAFTEYGCLFLNGTCGWPSLMALNVPSPAYPAGALGLRLAVTPTEGVEWRIAVFDGDPDAGDPEGEPLNHYGLYADFDDDAFLISELQFRWPSASPLCGSPGTARLGGWFHSGKFEDLRSVPDNFANVRGNWGGYATLEQQLWTEPGSDPESNQGGGLFFRSGLSPDDRNVLELYLEGGFVCQGLLPGRDLDVCGVAFAYGQVGGGLRRAVWALNEASGVRSPLPDYETVLEAEYRAHLRPGWTLQPGIHWIGHPGGSGELPDAWVLSLRSTVSF